MGVFANALSFAVGHRPPAARVLSLQRFRLVAWFLSRFHHREFQQPRLALVQRIVLAPRQTVALIEADGQRVLVATSPEGTPAFFSLLPTPNNRRTAQSLKNAAEKARP
ncbi:flagellar biosynthetic protein FliO [Telmatobacter sp. DSM 110680]|uniref:Flagellar biosynthetic protein FliO n=1 Tax=Telmatobacter sp. DSM 110680 TaxID=3036704 RepID=A0AAU7DGF0_9BACT